MQIYINKNNQQLGPFEETQIKEFLQKGELLPNDLGFRQGDTNWSPLVNLFPANPNPNPVQANLVEKQVSKVNWILFYSASLLGFLISIPMLLLAFYGREIFPSFNYFGYKPREIMPVILIVGGVMLIQFWIIHHAFISQLSRKLWAKIGLETTNSVATLNPLLPTGGIARKKRFILEKYKANRWLFYPENFKKYFEKNNLPIPDTKMSLFKIFGKSCEFPTSIILMPFQPLLVFGLISQACNAINSIPPRATKETQQIFLS